MTKHVIASAGEIPSGTRKTFEVKGRPIVVFNHDGEYFAMLDRCPHAGGRLSQGHLISVIQSSEPGVYCRSRPGEMLKCPWHGWEFDLRTGQSWCDPQTIRTRNYAVAVESGHELAKGPFVAETFPVSVDDNYVVVDM